MKRFISREQGATNTYTHFVGKHVHSQRFSLFFKLHGAPRNPPPDLDPSLITSSPLIPSNIAR